MVWQVVVLPGAQTVTLVNAMFAKFAGPASTLIACTFWGGAGGDGEELLLPPPPPPPQPASDKASTTPAIANSVRMFFIGSNPRQRLAAAPREYRYGRRKLACVRQSER